MLAALALVWTGMVQPQPAFAQSTLAQASPVKLVSKDGLTIEITGLQVPVPLNQMFSLQMRALQNGAPFEASSVSLEGERLYSKNALPTAPGVTRANKAGEWRINGLRFHIAGPWRLFFRFQTQAGVREIVFPLEVK